MGSSTEHICRSIADHFCEDRLAEAAAGLKPVSPAPLLPQLYDVSSGTAVKLGETVVLNITDGAGTDADPFVATVGPFAQPMSITAAVQATGGAGGSTTALSAQSNVAVIGESWGEQVAR